MYGHKPIPTLSPVKGAGGGGKGGSYHIKVTGMLIVSFRDRH